VRLLRGVGFTSVHTVQQTTSVCGVTGYVAVVPKALNLHYVYAKRL
jgi:hypothetical protein